MYQPEFPSGAVAEFAEADPAFDAATGGAGEPLPEKEGREATPPPTQDTAIAVVSPEPALAPRAKRARN